MIVCLCKAVSDREVDDLVRRGAGTAAAVGQMSGAGTDCGACVSAIEERICGRTGARCTGAQAHAHDERGAAAAHSG